MIELLYMYCFFFLFFFFSWCCSFFFFFFFQAEDGIRDKLVTGVQTCALPILADEYLRAVKVRQPEGPYYLCGYSFGGLVAFEMARRLLESGEDVALVGLFDTMTSPLQRPLRSWFSIARRRVVQFAKGERISEGLRSVLKSRSIGVIKVSAGAMIASARYRPRFYPGELTLFTPVEREPGVPPL